MIIGYLLVCLSTNCQVYSGNFETFEACVTAGTSAVAKIPKSNPEVTKVDFRCDPTGVPVKETY
jgi:hypothetical protein